MPARSTPAPALTPAERFRPIILEAAAAGVDLSQQVLELTYGDSARLKRDQAIPEDDIRFEDGAMVFIGVRVVEGAASSGLALSNNPPAGEPPPETLQAAKGQKKSNKEVRKPKAEKAKPGPAGRDFTSPPGKSR